MDTGDFGRGQVKREVDCNYFNIVPTETVKQESNNTNIFSKCISNETDLDNKNGIYQEQNEEKFDENKHNPEYEDHSKVFQDMEQIKNDNNIDIFYEDIKREIVEEQSSELSKFCEMCNKNFSSETDLIESKYEKLECRCQEQNGSINLQGDDMTQNMEPSNNILTTVPPGKQFRREKYNENPTKEYDSSRNLYVRVENNDFSMHLPLDNTSPAFIEDDDRDENFDVGHFSDDSEISDESDEEAIIPDERFDLSPPLSERIKNRNVGKKKVIRCKFCNKDVNTSNFTRHIERKHRSKPEVKKILILPKNSKKRRQAFILLRNETNFDLFINGITRPRRRGGTLSDEMKKYYPCVYCKGLFLRNYLKRHAKYCVVKIMDKDKKYHVSASHTFTACAMDTTNVISKLNVKRQVFDHMKGDDIAFEAKKDLLIVHSGESYLKKHKRKGIAHSCSIRMRELARLLMAYRRIISDNTVSLKDMLRPNKFDLVLSAVRDIAGYDPVNKTFKVPSLAMNLGTSLKHVCNELLNLVFQEYAGFKCLPNMSTEDWLKEVKDFMKLIESRWTIELTSLANKDLQEKKSMSTRKQFRREKKSENPDKEYDSSQNLYVENNDFSMQTSSAFIEKEEILRHEKVSTKNAETIGLCVSRRGLDENDVEYFKSHETKTYTKTYTVSSSISDKNEIYSECTPDELKIERPQQGTNIFSLDDNNLINSKKEIALIDEISLFPPEENDYINTPIKLSPLKEMETETQLTRNVNGFVLESPDNKFISVEDDDRDENFDVGHFSDDSEISNESDEEAIIPDEKYELLPPLSERIEKRNIGKKKVIRCKFCNEDVNTSNFTRHIERKHRSKPEVKKILILPRNSKERRQAFILLRNETNFDLFINGITRPRRRGGTVSDENKKYFPCAYCKGLFLRDYLRRHAKYCVLKMMDKDKKSYVSASHTLTACAMDTTNVISKLNVKRQVFDLMKGDDIAFEAKKDPLIVHSGESYLKKNKRAGIAHACSNRMRELARLLMAYRKIIGDNTVTLKDMLRPNKFDLVLSAVRDIAGYDPVNKTFKVPSLAMHLGTSLKHVCNELLYLVLQEYAGFKCLPNMSTRDWLEEVMDFMKLIESRWTIELASLANRELQEKKSSDCLTVKQSMDISDFQEELDHRLEIQSRIVDDTPHNEGTGEINESSGKARRKKSFRKVWTDHEVKCIEDEFDNYLKTNTYPSGAEIKQLIQKANMNRTIEMVKSKMQHMLKMRKGREL